MVAVGRILFVICLLAWSPALADKRVALVISASKYETLRPLENPENDADLIEDALEKLGFEVTAEQNRNLKRLRQAIENFAEDYAGADVALVYFAGHGVEIAGQNYLLPVDAEATSLARLKETGLPLEELRALLAPVSKSLLIVLDACRNDPFGVAVAASPGRSAVALGQDVLAAAKPGLGRVGRAENTLFAFSAAPGETASDGTGDNSPFASSLARFVGTNGLEIRSVLTLVQQEVYDQSGGKQLPYVESGLPQMFFAAETGPLPEREALLLAMADVTPDLRAEVDRIAAVNAMPLAPLYGALISADLKSMSLEDRDKKLTEAAQAFIKTRDELKTLASNDPDVARLRSEAEQALALGAFAKARGALTDAAQIDAQSSDALAGKLVARRLSEADTHQAQAGVALAQLDYPAAALAYERAAALHAKIEGEQLADADRRKRNWVLGDLGDLYARTGSSARALEVYRRMETAARLRLAKAPENDDAIRDLGLSLLRVSDVLSAQGDRAAALALLEENLKMRGAQRARMEARADQEWVANIAQVSERIGDILRLNRNLSEALRYYESTLVFRRWLVAANGTSFDNRDGLISILGRMGTIHFDSGDMTAAEKVWTEQLAVARKFVADFPDNVFAISRLSYALMSLGDAQVAQGRAEEAAVGYREIIANSKAMIARDPNLTRVQFDLAQGYAALGISYDWAKHPKAALEAFDNALAVMDKLVQQDEKVVDWRVYRARQMRNIGAVHYNTENYAEAAKWQAESVEILRGLAGTEAVDRDSWLSLLTVATELGRSRNFLGDTTGARIAFAEAVRAGDTLDLPTSTDRALRKNYVDALYNLAVIDRRDGRRVDARDSFLKYLAMEKRADAANPDTFTKRNILSLSVDAAKLSDDPKAEYEAALKLSEELEKSGSLSGDDATPAQLRSWIAALQ